MPPPSRKKKRLEISTAAADLKRKLIPIQSRPRPAWTWEGQLIEDAEPPSIIFWEDHVVK